MLKGKSNFLLLICLIIISAYPVDADDTQFDWRSDWALEKHFSITIDTEGYHFPTAIAFVPNPGKGPKDPLYFVTELRGNVKVVTNDRTVYSFAENFFQLKPDEELPSIEGEVGLAGICLEPENGYVFVTFAYQDSNNVLRNNIIRFHSNPYTFSLAPTSQVAFTGVFSSYESSISHQIGHCQIKDDLLYVSVGDGKKPFDSQSIDSILGKIIRMTLDGKPVPDNPFYQDQDVKKAANYVWALGFRNPFGLRIVEGRVFVADNGPNLDRFLEVHKGENYFWDNSSWSIGTNAAVVFSPSVAPVQIDYYPQGSTFFPDEYRGKFYVALAGGPQHPPGPGIWGQKSIIALEYGFKENKMLSVPKQFLMYQGSGSQLIVGLGFGPDGLYFVPLLPNQEGRSAIFKVIYNPTYEHPFLIAQHRDPGSFMWEKGCFGCHSLKGRGGTQAPPLDREDMVSRIRKRLNSEEYIQSLAHLDLIALQPYQDFKEARREVTEAEGIEKVRVWMKYHIMEPRFDNPYSQMPSLGLSERESLIITDYLLAEKNNKLAEKDKKPVDQNRGILPSFQIRYRHLIFSFIFGLSLPFLFLALRRLLR